MNSKAVKAISLVLLGCMLNNVFLEYIIKLDPGAGHLITFCQFLFIAVHGYIFTSKFGTVKPKIEFKDYLTLILFFFTTSVVNNWAFAFNIPVPLHMIFRAGSLIANMILGIVIVKRKYTLEKYISVLLITLGIIICTLYSSNPEQASCLDCDPGAGQVITEVSADHFFWWIIGIILLTGALLLSAGMGIFQEQLYKKHGKHPEEALYYTDVDSLLSVYLEECQSLTVTLVITLRKFFSLLFSIIYFQNPFTLAHWIGTIMVFAGTLMFSETHHKIKTLLAPNLDKSLHKSVKKVD
ncbi:hypothetical protein NQ314_016257 [Rhamnusium bicolor]|uniref:Uncharacterized protein n=1 Tax=Rhamnusium bicolor TaxID=1586634 RepID=A0AAV8WX82_9CUCU|nr:hypothetical protein NQ314_016257 [Rhamnusium bicolor]